MSHEEAVRVILQGDGRTMPEHFAPEVLEWFRQNHLVMDAIFQRFKDRD
jgi:response regulator RpfG family c-di-GMP phosphodiesterase